MRSFIKLTGLASIASICSVFAAWNFRTGVSKIDSTAVGISINIEDTIVNEGLSGTLKFENDENGDNLVTVKQTEPNEFSFIVRDLNEDKLIATYYPGIGEQIDKYKI